jgi:hypothetical protein
LLRGFLFDELPVFDIVLGFARLGIMKSLRYAAVAALAASLVGAAPRPQLELVGAFATGKLGDLLGSETGSE